MRQCKEYRIGAQIFTLQPKIAHRIRTANASRTWLRRRRRPPEIRSCKTPYTSIEAVDTHNTHMLA